jgi:hypothetical protein
LMEKEIGAVPIEKDEVTVQTKPYEIKTVKIEYSPAPGNTP